MASLTTFQGRRCTKVRRAASNGPSSPSPSPTTKDTTTSTSTSTSTSITSQSTTSVSSSSKSVFAPTTNFPGQAGGNQIATVNIPQVLPLPDPTPNPQPTPKPARPPPQDPPPQPAPPPPPPPPPSQPPQNAPPQQQQPPPQAAPPPSQATPPPDQPQNAPPPPPQNAPQPANNPPANNPPPDNPPANNQPANNQPANNQPANNDPANNQPLNNPPTNQPNPSIAQAGTGGGTGAGTGGGTGSFGGNPGEPGSGVVVSDSPNAQSLIPIAQLGSNDGSPISGGTGPANTDGVAPPQPILFSSGGVQATGASPTGLIPSGRGTGTGNLQSTLKGAAPTGGAGFGAGSGAGEQGVSTRSKSTPIIAGVVTGIIAIAVICGILFFCARRRKRQPRDLLASAQNSTRNFFATRKSRRDDVAPVRSTTPSIERGFGQAQYMQEVDIPRPRSSSEPASRALGAAPATAGRNSIREAMLPTVGEHRRSVSSISGLAYPITSDFNNPFKDPDPGAELRIVNEDLSRQGTPASALATPPRVVNPAYKPFTPFAGAAAVGGLAAGIGASQMFKPAVSSPKGQSNMQDPFRDPEPLINPFADPEPQVNPFVGAAMVSSHRKQDSEDSQSQYSEDSPVPVRHSGHTRSRTSTAVPLITKTGPSSVASSHVRNGSTDSGFVSAGSPGSVHSPRFGINNIFRRANSKKDANRSLLPQVQPTSNPISANPPRLSIPRSHVPQTPGGNRLSTTSSSSSLSLSFPSSWGSPGPTRPVSFATQAGLTLPHRNNSRVSDPFDLDLPELLTYANSDNGYSAVTIGSKESEKSAERRENAGPASRRRQPS